MQRGKYKSLSLLTPVKRAIVAITEYLEITTNQTKNLHQSNVLMALLLEKIPPETWDEIRAKVPDMPQRDDVEVEVGREREAWRVLEKRGTKP